ncbi:protein of unknown function (DUF4188) [Streptoalloteichus tenebrarius]|uniref:DUF4188 domain-containing protein n=1 Tax=Streptoalloteichus tenebrarius (strain ATCC 17920 / DSM 40477 / JCM 4838 / CBS 697.72 / NBRC 16177 / NCIMB 11028 / NRRL B-12390 / A12253. 1 / ISP 5477) TaxID=1933 RepID=A0ABT1HY77_STRSD|nr:protein of unknown function (DUF4188) [Streptoalloteichus tenebrarius]BFF02735.1 DUF4188 domain-containing protein [Streptoalloteichus tenebrarius]
MVVRAGRWTAEVPEDGVTVFLIGMRVNRPLRVDRWWPVFRAMPRMLRHLAEHPEAGLLGWRPWFGRTTLLLTYWRSVEHLLAFAGDQAAPHAPAWRDFNRRVGADGTVGVWHETYQVRRGSAEAVYVNMPPFGMAAATTSVPVTPATTSARRRLGDAGRS